MEFIWGESLEKRLQAANAPLLESDVLHWAIQLCDALHYLHTRQPSIIFRDMKPSNVMVTNTGLVKLIDFGIARTYKAGKKRDTVAMGSENYAAPEQWGKGQTDARSDVYALGATMYHLLANMAPTPAFLPSEPLPIRNYNGALSKRTVALIEKAMSRNREGRFQTVSAMRQTLVDALPHPYVPPAAVASRPSPQPVPPQAEPGKAVRPGPAPPASTSAPQARDSAQPRPRTRPEALPAPTPHRQAAAAPPAPARQTQAPAGSSPPSPQARPRPVSEARPRPAPPTTKPCPACRRPNKESARFCSGCGHAFVPLPPAVLRVIEPVRAAWEMPVSQAPMLLGRASTAEGHRPDFDMTFYDEGDYVSRRHARITRTPGGYFVTDLDSSNGTTVNGQRLAPHRARQLRNGDRIKVGLVVIRFCLR
jgi:hypothetical protein